MSKKVLAEATIDEIQQLGIKLKACQQVSSGVSDTLQSLLKDLLNLNTKLQAVIDSEKV